MMRGYRKLKNEGCLDLISSIKDQIGEQELSDINSEGMSRYLGAGMPWATVILRQFLLLRFAGLDLNKAILVACNQQGRISIPLPREWRRVFRDHHFLINERKSALLWFACVAMYWLRGTMQICIVMFLGLKAALRHATPSNENSAFFHSLSDKNLPFEESSEPEGRNIFSWYSWWSGKFQGVTVFEHDVKDASPRKAGGIPVVPGSPIPLPRLPHEWAAYMRWALFAIIGSFLDLLRGHWIPCILLGESAKAAAVRYAKAREIPKENMFHNSNWLYRPLWTYEAEARGSATIFYFYSTNAESFKRPEGYARQENQWHFTNWPRYLVWDEWQRDFILRVTPNKPVIDVVGPIDFTTGITDLPAVEPGFIAVFDVQPVRKSYYECLGIGFEYYTPETAIRFLEDIAAKAAEAGKVVLLKKKRTIGKAAHPRYRNIVEQLTAKGLLMPVDPSTDARRMIARSSLVISMPFTSTALLGREEEKPSCYYDAAGLVQKDDRAAHGIAIVSGPEELANWIYTSSLGGSE